MEFNLLTYRSIFDCKDKVKEVYINKTTNKQINRGNNLLAHCAKPGQPIPCSNNITNNCDSVNSLNVIIETLYPQQNLFMPNQCCRELIYKMIYRAELQLSEGTSCSQKQELHTSYV